MQSINRMALVFFTVAGLLGLIAVGVVVSGLSQVASASASSGWPQTSGKVTTFEVKFDQQQTARERGVSYVANVVYEYVVNGKTYSSRQVKIGVDNASANTAQQIVNKYPLGATVRVHYAPDDPRNAVLEPGVTAGSFGFLAFAAMLIVAAVVFGAAGVWLRGVSKGVAEGRYQVEEGEAVSVGRTRRATTIRSTPRPAADDRARTSFSAGAVPFLIMLILAVVGSAILYIGRVMRAMRLPVQVGRAPRVRSFPTLSSKKNHRIVTIIKRRSTRRGSSIVMRSAG